MSHSFDQYCTPLENRLIETSKRIFFTWISLRLLIVWITPFLLRNLIKWYGVTGHLLDWFTDYLTNRSQRVVIDGVASQYLPVTSIVPQGSIVGPLLFVVFINDLPEFIPNQSKTALFADDTKLYRSISSISDCESLQCDISSLNDWSQNSNMKFNALKCKVLTITCKKSPVTTDVDNPDNKCKHNA